ncbi:MAG: hypothetical protein ACLSB9_36815 [Hydrogeniiclostridium mannosilyticum]
MADVGSHSISGYYRNVYLTQDVKYKPFYSFLGNGETVSAFAVTIPAANTIWAFTTRQRSRTQAGCRISLRAIACCCRLQMVYTARSRASVPMNMPIGYSRMKVAETGGIEGGERAETLWVQLFGDAEIVLLLPIGSICSETISDHPETR